MTAYLFDPILLACACGLVLALWAWWPYVEALGELSGLLAADSPGDGLPMWAVVVGGWSVAGLGVWALWSGLGWLVTR
jgi:hypothetical protein